MQKLPRSSQRIPLRFHSQILYQDNENLPNFKSGRFSRLVEFSFVDSERFTRSTLCILNNASKHPSNFVAINENLSGDQIMLLKCTFRRQKK